MATPVQYGPYRGEPKPVTAFVLSMVGGVFILLGGAFEFYFSFFYSQVAFPPRFGDELAVLGAIGIGVGVLAIVFAVLLYLYPQHHALFGGLILVASVVSAVSYWGFLIGLVLGVVGGVLAIAWVPFRWPLAPYGYGPPGGWQYGASATAPSAYRACMKCGLLAGRESKFCPHCGNPMGP